MNSDYKSWIGRCQEREDFLTRQHDAGFRALLDLDPDAPTPLGLHWLMGVDREPQSDLGDDGHPKKGGFLPPVTLPRRMWAQGNIRFLGRCRMHRPVVRRSTIADITTKSGRSGSLVFVRVDHDYSQDGAVWIAEQHLIVYRQASDGPYQVNTNFEPVNFEAWSWHEQKIPSAVHLFRYSALTFNSHRIHYDYPYVTEVEGYPGLVVHGPLMATWLMNFAQSVLNNQTLMEFGFRVLAPVFAGERIVLLARPSDSGLELAVAKENGEPVISASATSDQPGLHP